MSKPTPLNIQYQWHRNALLPDHERDDSIPTTEDPQCGWFKRKLVKGGVFVPARIWLHSPTDDEGDLVADETYQCEVDGQYADPEEAWPWLCANPITEAEFNYLAANRRWSEEHAPDEPYANPRQAVDWLKVPTPTFKKEPAP